MTITAPTPTVVPVRPPIGNLSVQPATSRGSTGYYIGARFHDAFGVYAYVDVFADDRGIRGSVWLDGAPESEVATADPDVVWPGDKVHDVAIAALLIDF